MANSPLDVAMTRLAEGDRAAFDVVFAGLWPIVRRFSGRLVHVDADGEDAAQLAMEKVFSRASDFHRGRAVLPWVLSLATWECRTLNQKRARRREATDEIPDVPTSSDESEVSEALQQALTELSPVDQDTLREAFFDELEGPMNPALRKRKSRALDRLKALVEKFYGR